MANLVPTYQLIGDILDLNSASALDALTQKLKTEPIDWDSVVIEGSKHLVLPALYCQLKAKQLLTHLPEELSNYLEDITAINRNRNKAILKQALSLSKLLTVHQIEHVFLKGTALCAGGYFEDIAERMIGDIDILIAQPQLEAAYRLLKTEGYTGSQRTLGDIFFEKKHLPRLRSKDGICAVELHLKLLANYELDALKSDHLIKHKNQNHHLNIPSHKHLLLHNILNHQINDSGRHYNSISFRAAYDTTLLLHHLNTDERKSILSHRLCTHYLKHIGLFFKSIRQITKLNPSLINNIYLIQLRAHRVNTIYYNLTKKVKYLSLLTHRLYIFITNTKYRKAVWHDRTRILKEIKT